MPDLTALSGIKAGVSGYKNAPKPSIDNNNNR
jgi:hypothetical protein